MDGLSGFGGGERGGGTWGGDSVRDFGMNAERSGDDTEYHSTAAVPDGASAPGPVQPSGKRRRQRSAIRLWAERRVPGVARALINLLWRTCRVEVQGTSRIEHLLESGQAFIPCYWHGHQLFCVHALLALRERHPALKLGHLISPSRDGNAAAEVLEDLGLHVIRGSATRGGAQALRDIYQSIRRDGVSPIVTPDGPTGPYEQFKPGVALLASLAGAPLVPLSFSAPVSFRLSSWDKALIPLPFSRVRVLIGLPVTVERELDEPAQIRLSAELSRTLTGLGTIAGRWAPFDALPEAQRPTVHRVEATATGVTIGLALPSTLPWFEGHFPDNPVMPGVAAVHLAVIAAEALLMPERQLVSSGRLKFQQPVLPGTPLSLHLSVKGSAVKFVFECDSKVCVSGSLRYLESSE